MSRHRVVVEPMESGPQGPGRMVVVDGRDVGLAESWDGVDDLIDAAGLPPDTAIEWNGGGPESWD